MVPKLLLREGFGFYGGLGLTVRMEGVLWKSLEEYNMQIQTWSLKRSPIENLDTIKTGIVGWELNGMALGFGNSMGRQFHVKSFHAR